MSRSSPSIKVQEETIKRFVHNLDQLVGNEDKKLYGIVPQQKIDEAINDFPVVDDEGNNFSIFTSIQKFKKFAPGIYLMFKLLKHLMLMFGIITIVSIVQIVVLFKSPFYQGYESVVRINMLRLTIASLKLEDYEFYIALDAIILLIVCGFYVWWSQNLRRFANQCNEENKLPSYLTVKLRNVSKTFTEQSLQSYLIKKEGIVPQQIYTGRNYGKFLKHYKRLTQCAIDLRIMKQLFANEEDEEQKKKQAKPILQKFLELKKLYLSIKLEKFNEKKYSPKQVFIVLQNEEDRQKILSNSSSMLNICSNAGVEAKEFDFTPCQVQPEAIVWENIGISFVNYAIRAIVVFLIIGVVACLGVILIFILEILETASIGDAYHYHEEKSMDDKLLAGETGMQSNSAHHEPIDPGKLTLLIIMTPLVIFLCKKLIMGLLSHFVKFRKYPSEVSRIKSQTITLSVFYFTVICDLHLFLYLKTDTPGSEALSIYQLLYPMIIKMFSITNYNPASIHLYSDYSLDWYKEATFFIIIIGSTSFNIANGFKFIVNYVSYTIQKRKARKQKTMFQVKKYLHGVDIHMEHAYASLIVINYFALLYGCPMPITVCFSFVNLVFLFYITKLTLIKFCHKPIRIGHSINRTVSNLLFIGIIIHCIMSPIFLCAQGIGKNNSHYKYNLEHPQQSVNKQPTLTVEQRYQKLGPFYLTVLALMTVYVLLRKPLFTLISSKIKQKFNKEENDTEEKKTYFGLYPSYSMHNNPVYGEVLKNIYLMNRMEAKRITCPMPKTLKKLQSQICEQSAGVFNRICEINREYLDREKYGKIFEEVELVARIEESSDIMLESQLSDKATNDNILFDGRMTDRVKQTE